jgi:hypothetical protein
MKAPTCMYRGCVEPPVYDVTPTGSVRKCATHRDRDRAEPWGTVERVFYEPGERRPRRP